MIANKLAFPCPVGDSSGVEARGGLTVRQYYAGLAMQAILSNGNIVGALSLENADGALNVALDAVEYADALIAELSK